MLCSGGATTRPNGPWPAQLTSTLGLSNNNPQLICLCLARPTLGRKLRHCCYVSVGSRGIWSVLVFGAYIWLKYSFIGGRLVVCLYRISRDSVSIDFEWITLDPVFAHWKVCGGVSPFDLVGFGRCWSSIGMFGYSICSSSVVCLCLIIPVYSSLHQRWLLISCASPVWP